MAKKTAPETATGETVTKTEAVKRAIADGIETPTEGVAYIREKFDLDITPPQFSTYKSLAKKKAGHAPARRGPKSQASGGITVGNGRAADAAALARDVKRLVEVYGAEAVSDMAKVFAE